jgi:hypothetical protein
VGGEPVTDTSCGNYWQNDEKEYNDEEENGFMCDDRRGDFGGIIAC